MNRMPKTIGPWAFVGLVLATGLAAFFCPFGSWRDAKIMTLASSKSSAIYMAGTSVLKHISACDSDQRHVTDMLSQQLGEPVKDLSFGGQTLVEEAAYVGTAMHNPKARILIASVSLTDLTPTSEPALRRRLLFAMASPPSRVRYGSFVLSDLVLGRDLPMSFDYDGERFSSYDYIKQKYLAVERDQSTCPEGAGHDMRFVKAIYYGNYVARPLEGAAVDLMARTTMDAHSRGMTFLLVIMPIDLELVTRLDAGLATAIRRQRDGMLATLRARGVDVIDLSEQVPDSGFADRWCACGHLQAPGRQVVADRIAGELHARALVRH